MKKVLVIGELTENIRNVGEGLKAEFDVQYCNMDVKSILGMVKILKPALLVMMVRENEEVAPEIIDTLAELKERSKVLVLANKDDEARIRLIRQDVQFYYYRLPASISMIVNTSKEILKVDKHPEKMESSKKNILLIDDSAIFLRNTKEILKDWYDVELANSGQMGITKAREIIPDLILLDYEMPGMDGKMTHEKLLDDPITRDIPVIYLTSVSDRKRVVQLLENSPAGYVLKPVDADILMNTIRDVFVKQK